MNGRIALVMCGIVLNAAAAFPQTDAASDEAQRKTQQQPQVDAAKLPVSLGRIRMQLSAPDTTRSVLRLQRTIEVVGVAPPIELWNPAEKEKMTLGPVPFAPPTQKEIHDVITPQEFRRYPIDLNALLEWLARKAKEQADE